MVNEKRTTSRKSRFKVRGIGPLFRPGLCLRLGGKAFISLRPSKSTLAGNGVSTGSGSDRVSIDLRVEIARTVTRSLPLPILTSSSNRHAGFRHQRLGLRKLLCYNHTP